MSVHANDVEAPPKPDPVFLHVKAGMSVIVKNTDETWRKADVIHIIGGIKDPKVPTLLQVAYVNTGVINWYKADLVTLIIPRL